MAEKNKNPEVRFAGFTDDWEQHELGEVLTERKILQKISDDAPILAFASGQGVIDRSERKSNNRDHLTLDQANKIYKLTEYNDIVYNPSNLKYGAIDRNKHGRGVISPIYVTFTTEQEPSFIELIVKSEKFKLRALQYEEGTVVKRQSVKPENLLSLDVNISPSPVEQKKIGALFEHIENLITRHQRKYNKLVTVKNAMLEKMFPKKSADVPEIRFKGYSGAWERRRLGDEVADIIGGGTPSTFNPAYWNGDIDWYSPTEIGEKVYANGSEKKITELGLQNSSAKLLPAWKTVLFTSRAGIGDMAILQRYGATNQGFQSLVLKEGYDTYFVYSMGHLIKQFAEKHSSGSTFLEISGKMLGKMEIKVPSFQEQIKIGAFFKQLDNLISLHQRELEKLKNIKRACFEKMFV